MSYRLVPAVCLLLVLALILGLQSRLLAAEECRLEQATGLPTELAPEISKVLNASHIKLRLGAGELCELWLAKAWKRRAEANGAAGAAPILYPLEPGSLIGAIRLASACHDLRDQEIPAGVYTLRYAVQPDVEAHKDSHDSRDFLLLVASSIDKSPERIADQDKLIGLSADSIASMHPTFLPLLTVAKPAASHSVRRDPRDASGWLLQVHGKDNAGKEIPMEIILPHPKGDN